MFNLRIQAIAFALISVSGCATMQEMPPPSAAGEIRACTAPAAGQQAMLCDTVEDIQVRSEAYVDRHTRVAGERTAVQGLTLAAGLAGGGFAAFDAHEDNIEAAGIIAAGGLLLDRGLNMRSRVDILRSGALAMNCYASVGVTFANAYSAQAPDADGNARTLPRALDDVIQSLGEHLAQAREALGANLTGTGNEAAAKTALTQLVTRGEAMMIDLVKAQRALSRAPDDLEIAWRAADADVLKRLDGTRPDLVALVREAQQLSAGLADPAPGAGTAPTGGTRGLGQEVTYASIATAINADLRDGERIDPGRYIASYERIAQCRAQAAS